MLYYCLNELVLSTVFFRVAVISDKTVEKILQAENGDVQIQDGIGFLINSLFLCNSFFILEAYLAYCI